MNSRKHSLLCSSLAACVVGKHPYMSAVPQRVSDLFVGYANGAGPCAPTAGGPVLMSGADKQIGCASYWLVKVKHV